MLKHFEITRDRLAAFAARLREKVYPARAPLRLSVFAAPDRIPYAQAMQGTYRPAEVGEKFGPLWATHWFRAELEIPEAWAGREVHLLWDATAEACVWEGGVPRQGLTGSHGSQASNGDGAIRPEFILARNARGGEERTLYIEHACNHLFGVRGNEAPTDLTGYLRRAEIAVFDRAAWDLLWDFVLVQEMATHLPPETPRAGQALALANRLANQIDPDDATTWPAARALAQAFLAEPNGAGQHHLSAIGHAHIDSAWLWPRAETKRKCYRTFSTAMAYMADYPAYRFALSQAVQFEWMKQEQPALYAQMREWVRLGKLVPTGGTWVEPDCNLPSGEALVRQFLVGQRFFQQEFGLTCNVFWNPDVFGYCGQLPQIMRGAGIDYFLTQKLSWNQFNKLPSHTFLWEGLDGSQVLTHFPPADTYNGLATVKEALYNVRNFKDHDRARESYLLFGYGDGGGGPTREMLERLQRMADVDGLPKVAIRSPQDFFARCAADIKDPLVWVGELYFELHRGTYTTQAATKRGNRVSEILLHEAELWAALAHGRHALPYPTASLLEAWKLVLFNQFHDVLPGSSITEVYQDALADYAEVARLVEPLREAACTALVPPAKGGKAARVAVFNALPQERTEVVELPAGFEGAQMTPDGAALGVVTAPALGYAIQTPATAETPVALTESAAGYVLQNAFVRATVSPAGTVTSLVHLATGRECVAPGAAANQLVLFDDHPNRWEAWDVDVYHLEQRRNVAPATACRVLERGPLRATLEFTFQVGRASQLVQRVQLTATSPVLSFDCQAAWHESCQFLKVEFPLHLRAAQASYETQFGHLQRPTHFNTSWDVARFEVCAHRWADLAEPDFGVALLNDCKYGHAAQGNVLRLSLLRAPKAPDPEADMGDHHRFRYGLLPHAGSLQEAGVVATGMAFNNPLHSYATGAAAGSFSAFSVDRPALVLDTVKLSEDGRSLVLRLYEAHGTRGSARLASPLPVARACLANLLETPGQALAWRDGGLSLDYSPFQILTVRLDLAGTSAGQ